MANSTEVIIKNGSNSFTKGYKGVNSLYKNGALGFKCTGWIADGLVINSFLKPIFINVFSVLPFSNSNGIRLVSLLSAPAPLWNKKEISGFALSKALAAAIV